MKLAIYGAGRMGPTFLYLAQRINRRELRWDEILFVDDTEGKENVGDVRVLPFSKIEEQYTPEEIEFTVSVGDPWGRERVAERIETAGYRFAMMIDPDWGEIPPGVTLEPGVVILDRTPLIDCNVHIGKNTLVQTFTDIGHGSVVGAHCNIAPFTMICGNCTVGKGVFFGVHSAVKENTVIEDGAIIGMCAAVNRNVPKDHAVLSPVSKTVPIAGVFGEVRSQYLK